MEVNLDDQAEIIEWAIKEFPDLVMTTGLNLAGTVLIDVAYKTGFKGEVILVDTGFHFPETLNFWDSLKDKYKGLTFTKLGTVDEEKDPLYLSDPISCCAINKVAPLEKYLKARHPSGLLNARTRDSAGNRGSLKVVENGDPTNINPFVNLSRSNLEEYAKFNGLDFHPLYELGFLSMGCWPCTKAVRPGEDPRSGRFVGQCRTECGIWGTVGEVENSPDLIN